MINFNKQQKKLYYMTIKNKIYVINISYNLA